MKKQNVCQRMICWGQSSTTLCWTVYFWIELLYRWVADTWTVWCVAVSHSLGTGRVHESEKHFRCAVDVKHVAMQPNNNSIAISNGLCRMRVWDLISSVCYSVWTSLYMLGVTLQQQEKLEEAETIGVKAVEMLRISQTLCLWWETCHYWFVFTGQICPLMCSIVI